MKYCIYKGDLYKVTSESASMLHFCDNWGSTGAMRQDVMEVPEQEYKVVETELTAARLEISSLKERIYKLDEAYREKSETLRHLMMESRQKEIAIVSKLIRVSIIRDKEA